MPEESRPTCPVCGEPMEEEVPRSAMGEPMYRAAYYVCRNPRCPRYDL